MSDETPLLEPWIRLTRRRWRTGLVLAGALVALGVALLFLTRPVYRSEASLRLGEPPPPGGVSPTSGMLSFFQLGGDPFANDLELLGSRSLAEAVVEEMALNVSLQAPAGWHRDSLLASVRASRETEEASFQLRWREDGRLDARRTAPSDSAIGIIEPGTPATFGGVTLVVRPWREGMPREYGLSTVPFARAARVTRSSLEFERPRREANIVTLSFQDTDPGLADGVLAAVVGEFVRLRTDLQHRESTQSADSLRTVARSTERELREVEAALEQLQRTRRLVAPTAQSEALVERQGELLSRLARARAELRGVDLMLERLDALSDPSRSWTALLSYPAFLENETFGSMLVQMTELHAQREALATRRTADNTQLRLLDERIAYLDGSLREVAREYRAGLVDQIGSVQPQVEELDALLASIPAEALELARRQRDVRLLSEVLVLTEQRLRQEELREALTYANVQVVDPPALLDRPVWPRKKLGLALLLVLASGFGLFGMIVRDRTDPRVRTVGEIEASLGRPLVAVVRARSPGGVRIDDGELEVLARRMGSARNGRSLTLVPAGGHGEAVARKLANGDLPEPVPGAQERPDRVRLRALRAVRELRDAAVVAGEHGPVVLVVEAGRTTRAELRHTVRLIEEAGGAVCGAILVCARERDARGVWD